MSLPLEPGFRNTGPCWVCGSSDKYPFVTAPFEFSAFTEQDPDLAAYTGMAIGMSRCRTCGFSQPDALPTLPDYFTRMYNQQWSAEWVDQEFKSTYKDVIFNRVLKALGKRLPPERRTLLDIGAHAGRFIYLAGRRGWQAHGTEINPRTAAYAAEHSGATVHRVKAEDVGTLGLKFDAVTLTDVLEHIPKPSTTLKVVRTVLAQNGWLAIKVPCGPAQLIKERTRAILRPGYRIVLADNLVHVNQFSPLSLRTALELGGFTDISVEIAAPECPPRARAVSAARIALWSAMRHIPYGLYSPAALHLQAYARNPAAVLDAESGAHSVAAVTS